MPETNKEKTLFAGFLQFDVRSGEIISNLSRVEQGLSEIAASGTRISPGIIVLPELWATGFAYNKLPELTREIPDILKILQNLATEYEIIIAGSLPEYADNTFYNTLFISDPSGIAGTYRKQRLFSPMQEDSFFTPGTEPLPVQTDLGPIGGLVCYDLRFPELLRKQTGDGADLAVVSAQWPAVRIDHWRILLQARAVENQMFVIAANRCGKTGDTSFGGHSMIIGPEGSILLEAGEEEEFKGELLDIGLLSSARSLFRSLPDRKTKDL
ncbi:MAG: carbon-nitrogen family hydrolase [Deltaproteobacteria bacterium]|jgi:predicted amidohydrolase|nr:carbon-nitrogen family hydrolase [Deltaproteobacteria bacterium]